MRGEGSKKGRRLAREVEETEASALSSSQEKELQERGGRPGPYCRFRSDGDRAIFRSHGSHWGH